MKKALLLFLLLAVCYIIYFFFFSENTSISAVESAVTTSSGNATSKSDEDEESSTLGLALKSINLSQGERGIKLWRLHATAASMVKEKGVIKINLPNLIYYMQPDNEELHVTSEKGSIDQENQVLKFIDNVLVNQKNSTMKGALLIYNGTDKTMSFPDGGIFNDNTMNGAADTVVWFLNSRIIEGEGGVTVNFSTAPNVQKNLQDKNNP